MIENSMQHVLLQFRSSSGSTKTIQWEKYEKSQVTSQITLR